MSLNRGMHFWLATGLLLIVVLPTVAASPVYEYTSPDREGIGKRYLGRSISHVMGHRGAAWLERRSRQAEERTDLLVQQLPLTGQSRVADIGAGTGYFTFPVAKRVPEGKVFAVDIQQEMLDIIDHRKTSQGVSNVETVLGTVEQINLPASSVDLVFIVDAYHEFSHPYEMGRSIFDALKPGGQLVLIEYRGEDPKVPIKRLHKMTVIQARKEMQALGFVWQKTLDTLPQQHMLIFTKPFERVQRLTKIE